MSEKIINTPTNLIMGFLGVGKTTAIINLLKQKPENEKWAVLVNEFGKVGVDGAIFSAAGAIVKEISGGCLCCAVALPFQVSINRLLKQVKPDRLLIEPTGLGHPKKVLDMLVGDSFKDVLDLRASICLIDPEKLKDERYTSHENFVDQIALSDVLIANKMDLAGEDASVLFHDWAKKGRPEKALVAQTIQGQLDVGWLDIVRNPQRKAMYPDYHQINKIYPVDNDPKQLQNEADGYQSFGYIFPSEYCFDYSQLNKLFSQLNAERIKGVFNTDKGWFVVNIVDNYINIVSSSASGNSRVEVIVKSNQFQDLSIELQKCRVGLGVRV